MPSRAVVVGLVALVTVLTVAAGAVLAADANGPGESDNKTITVAGSGEIDAEPDAAVVQLSVTARGGDAANVSDEVADDAADLREALAAFGLDDEQIQTQRYSIHERPESRDQPGETVYVGQQTFEVTLEDTERVGPLIDAAVDGGGDNVGGVHYTLSEDRRDRIRDRAIRAAIGDARGEASVIADATGLRLGGVEHASSRETNVLPYRAELSAADGGSGTDIDPRDVTVTATVEVTFDATPA